MSLQLAEMFRFLSGRKVSLCYVEQAQKMGLAIETRHFNQQLSPVEMFHVLEWFRLQYLNPALPALEFKMLVIVKEGTLICTQNASHLLNSAIYMGKDLIFCHRVSRHSIGIHLMPQMH